MAESSEGRQHQVLPGRAAFLAGVKCGVDAVPGAELVQCLAHSVGAQREAKLGQSRERQRQCVRDQEGEGFVG